MRKEDLKEYYFSTKELIKIRDKYFDKLKEIVVIDNLFNNQSLTDEELLDKQNYICNNIYKFISSNKRIRRDFYNAYGVVLINTLCNLVLESLVADEILNKDIKLDIFLDAESIVYCGEDCPLHIFLWHEQGISLYQYSSSESHDYDNMDNELETEIFGLEFVNK